MTMIKSGYLINFVVLFLVAIEHNVIYCSPFDRLVHIGIADGTSFFKETSTGRNWTNAKLYCNENGMKLATIKTAAQHTRLEKNLYGSHYPLWTAGRDAQTLSQFVWDQNSETPNGQILNNFTAIAPVSTCLAIYRGNVHSYHCYEALYTVCELVLGSCNCSAHL